MAPRAPGRDDETPHRLVGRAGLVFAYVCFFWALALICGAIYVLPAAPKVKIFLGAAAFLLTSMFVFMAVATHMVSGWPAKKPPTPK